MSGAEFSFALVSQSKNLQPFAVTLTRDHEHARDLVQETLFRAWAYKEKFDAGTNIKAWLFTIMRNIFINDYRRARRCPVITVDQELYQGRKDNRSGEEHILSRIGYMEIQRTIHQLQEIFRVPMLLYIEGYKYREIADLLDQPEGTIKSRIHFARKALRNILTADSAALIQ